MNLISFLILITLATSSFISCSAIKDDTGTLCIRESDSSSNIDNTINIGNDIIEPEQDKNLIGPLTMKQLDINSSIQSLLFINTMLIKLLRENPDSELIATGMYNVILHMIPHLYRYAALILSRNDFEKSIYSRMGLNSRQISNILMTDDNEKKLNLNQWIIGPLFWIIQIISFFPESEELEITPIQFVAAIQFLLFVLLFDFLRYKRDPQN